MQRANSIGARHDEIIETQVDAADDPPSLLACPDRAVRVGAVRGLPRVIYDRVVRQSNLGAAQHDARVRRRHDERA